MVPSSTRAEFWAWLAGWLMIVAFIAGLALELFAMTSQRDFPDHIVGPIQTGIFYVLLLIFLNGLRGFAQRKSDMRLLQTVHTLIGVNIVEMLLLVPFTFIRYFEANFITLTLVAFVPILCIYGILLGRIGESFAGHAAELGTLGSRIAWWSKISGWMYASVLLFIPGMLANLIQHFFLWRLFAASVGTGQQNIAVRNG